MSEPYLSEIRLMACNFAPKHWAMCNGQFLPINQNQALFALLGTTYGGNGQTTFALPDLRGRVPIHMGAGHTPGEQGGEQAHTLTIAELPTHLHGQQAVDAPANTKLPVQGAPAAQAANPYSNQPANAGIGNAYTNVGGSQAHLNMQPFLTLNYCICLIGIFPSQN